MQERDAEGQQHGKCEHGRRGVREPAERADGQPGESRMPDGVGEKGHPVVDDKAPEECEERRHDQDREQGVLHEPVLYPFGPQMPGQRAKEVHPPPFS